MGENDLFVRYRMYFSMGNRPILRKLMITLDKFGYRRLDCNKCFYSKLFNQNTIEE